MIKKFFFLCFLIGVNSSFAQQGDGGLPKSFKYVNFSKTAETKVFPAPDVTSLRTEDEANDKTGNGPWRFGFKHETSLTLDNSGTWHSLSNGSKLWQLKVVCENALTVNFLLKNVKIPAGNELYFYNPSKSFILGNFTENHLYNGELGTELIPGSMAIVEYYVPAENASKQSSIEISTVVHGYRTSTEFLEKAFGSSGSCNMNVNCPDGTPWVNQRNSSLMLVSGGNGFCSGALINNTQNDGKPYVLTANHCYSNPASWVFRFNWHAPSCANPGSSPSFESLSGAVLRAKRTPSDFCLVEITGGLIANTVPAVCNPYFSGWDNSGNIPTSAVSIHHPSGDITKISFDDDPLVISQGMGSSESNATWSLSWDRNTTTEGGSSGSPLFDQNHRIIGQLWGGGASCSNLSATDYYGRLANSWLPSGSDSSNQLKYWLDPTNLGLTIIDGYDPNGSPLALDAALSSPNGVNGTICGTSVEAKITLVNLGTTPLNSATINYGFNGSTPLSQPWTGSLNQYQSEVITLPTQVLTTGNYTFKAVVTNPNVGVDENMLNDTLVSSFSTVADGLNVDLSLTLDCYGDEISWVLQNSSGSQTFYSGGPYSQTSSNTTKSADFCLAEGCYKFVISDSYGDGMVGSWGCSNGSYTIKQGSVVLAELLAANANFGAQKTENFCVTASIDENHLLNSWDVYPNPSTEKFIVSSEVEGPKVIRVFNAVGQLIREFETTEKQIQLELNSKGCYMIQLQTIEGSSQKTVVVN